MKHVFTLILWATLCACADESVDHARTSAPLRMAVLPDQSRDSLLSQYNPLVDYLESATALEIELVLPLDYVDLVDQFDAGHVDLAWFGGLTFTQAEQRSRAQPLVFRDIDLEFTSCYLASAADARTTIDEFRGATFSFGPSLSTSGHLMPRYFMTNDGLDPDQFFASIRHSAGHDRTAALVADGTVALGVANCIIVQALFENGVLSDDDVRIIETTPPYSDYVWATRADLDERVKVSILDAFLSLDAMNPEHLGLLRLHGANEYLPAGREDFKLVRLAAIQADLLAEDDGN